MAQNENKAFVMYDSFIEAMRNLNGDDFKECVLAMADYAIKGIEPVSENPMIKIILTMALPNIDAAQRRHLQAVENGSKGKEYGKQGGRPRKGETPEQYRQRKLEENPQKPLKKERKEEIKKEIEIKNNVNTGGLDYSGFDSSFSFSFPLQGANNLNGQEVSTGTEIKPVNGQQDAKRINSQPVRDNGLEQAKNENNTVISTPVQGQPDKEYTNNLYKVASQAFGEVQANYVTIISTPENYSDKAWHILNKSGDYLFEQYQSLNGEQGEQAFGRIINALARYRLQFPEDKKVVVDVFKFFLRRENDERKFYQEQGLDYDEVYGQ